MRSIKPGRGPSMMGGVMSIVGIVFGIIWIFAAISMGAPFFFPLFGLVFIAVGIAQAVYNFKNATGKNRFSAFDITEDGEEPDPMSRFVSQDSTARTPPESTSFCPYCGTPLASDYTFCPKCGKQLPNHP